MAIPITLRSAREFIFSVSVACLLLAGQAGHAATDAAEHSDDEFPELQEINRILKAGQPDGIVFLVMDYDVEAYLWVLPRLQHYVRIMREVWPQIHLVILSHGDEIISLLEKNEPEYRSFHDNIRRLIATYDVDFQVCGAYAALSGIDESEFADFVDVVPSAPSQIKDYRQMDYKIVSLEQIW
jgi:intracellular sulfur oxidation DsrE/DsrF family protein